MDKFEKEDILEAMRAVLSDEQYLRLGEVLQAQMDKVEMENLIKICMLVVVAGEEVVLAFFIVKKI